MFACFLSWFLAPQLMPAGLLHRAAPPLVAPSRLDAWGDPLPPGALFRTGTLRTQHDITGDVRFSPDGKMLAGVAYDNTIRLWDAATGRTLRVLPGHQGRTLCLAFLPNGKTLISGGQDRTVWLRNVADGKEVHRFIGHQSTIDFVAPFPDGTWLASSDGRDFRFWDLKTGKQTRLIPLEKRPLFVPTLSPDGKLIAAKHYDDDVHIWETATGKPQNQFKGSKPRFQGPRFLPDGKTLLTTGTGEEKGVIIWDVATGKKLRHFAHITYPSVSPDGKIFAECDRSKPTVIRLFDAMTGKEMRRFPSRLHGSASLRFSPDGKILIASANRCMRCWDVKSGVALDRPTGHEFKVNAVAFSPDNRLLASGSEDGTVRLWDPITGREVRLLRTENEIVHGIAFLKDGTVLSQNDVRRPDQWLRLIHDEALCRVRLWEVKTGKERRHFDFPKSLTGPISFSSSLQMLAQQGPWIRTRITKTGVEAYTPIRFLEPASGKQVPELKTDHHRYLAMAFSPDGKLLAVTSDETGLREMTRLSVWDLASKKERWTHQETFDTFHSVAFSPDGKMVVTGSQMIRMWDAATGKELADPDGANRRGWFPGRAARPFEGCAYVAFSPDGKTLAAVAPGGSVILWEMATRKKRRVFAGHDICCLAFSADGRLLATGGRDSLVMAWDVTGETGARRRSGPMDRKALDRLWGELREEDASRAFDAVWTLSSSAKEALPFLEKRLPIHSDEDVRRIQRLINELDHEEFSIRERATRTLAGLGPAVEDALRKCLESKPSLEVRQRVEGLLRKMHNPEAPTKDPEHQRRLRLIEVLEHLGSRGAKEALQQVADRGLTVRVRQEARASLRRLAKTAAGPR